MSIVPVIELKLNSVPEIKNFTLRNTSEKHKSHSGNSIKSSETHFEIDIFLNDNHTALSKIKIHKKVTRLFFELYQQNLVHSIAIQIITAS